MKITMAKELSHSPKLIVDRTNNKRKQKTVVKPTLSNLRKKIKSIDSEVVQNSSMRTPFGHGPFPVHSWTFKERPGKRAGAGTISRPFLDVQRTSRNRRRKFSRFGRVLDAFCAQCSVWEYFGGGPRELSAKFAFQKLRSATAWKHLV